MEILKNDGGNQEFTPEQQKIVDQIGILRSETKKLEEEIKILEEKGATIPLTPQDRSRLASKKRDVTKKQQEIALLKKQYDDLYGDKVEKPEIKTENTEDSLIEDLIGQANRLLGEGLSLDGNKAERARTLLERIEKQPGSSKYTALLADLRILTSNTPEPTPSPEREEGDPSGPEKGTTDNRSEGGDVGAEKNKPLKPEKIGGKWDTGDWEKDLHTIKTDFEHNEKLTFTEGLWKKKFGGDKRDGLEPKDTDTVLILEEKIVSAALAVEVINYIIPKLEKVTRPNHTSNYKESLHGWRQLREKLEKAKRKKVAENVEITNKEELEKLSTSIKRVLEGVDTVTALFGRRKLISSTKETLDTPSTQGLLVASTYYLECLELANIKDQILKKDKQDHTNLLQDLAKLHTKLSALEPFDTDAFESGGEELKDKFNQLKAKLKEKQITEEDLGKRSSGEKPPKPKGRTSTGTKDPTTGTTSKDSVPRIKTASELQSFLDGNHTLSESLKNTKDLREIVLRLKNEDVAIDDIDSSTVTLINNARSQITDLYGLIPIGESVSESNFNPVKESILDQLVPIWNILNKISLDKKPEAKALLTSIKSFCKRIGKDLPSNKKEVKNPTEVFESNITDKNSPFITKLVRFLKKTKRVLEFGHGAKPDTVELQKMEKEIPDDLNEDKKKIIRDVVCTAVQELLTSVTDASCKQTLIEISIKLDIEVPKPEEKEKPLYTVKSVGEYKFSNKESFVRELKKGDKSEYLVDVKILLVHLLDQIKHKVVSNEDAQTWKNIHKSIPIGCEPADYSPLTNILTDSNQIQEAISLIPSSEKEPLLGLRKALVSICVVLKIEVPKETPDPVDTPEIRTIQATLRREDIITGGTFKPEYERKAPGFKHYVEGVYVKRIQDSCFESDLPDSYKKSIDELFALYEPHAKTINDLSKALEVEDVVNSDLYNDFLHDMDMSPDTTHPVLRQELINNIVMSVLCGTYETVYKDSVESIIHGAQKITGAREKIKSLESKLEAEQARLDTLTDPARELTEAEYNTALTTVEFPDVENDMDTFLERIHSEYETLRGGMKSDGIGFATSFYKRWAQRVEDVENVEGKINEAEKQKTVLEEAISTTQESIDGARTMGHTDTVEVLTKKLKKLQKLLKKQQKAASKEIKPLGLLGRIRNKTLAYFGSMETSDYVEVNKLQSKLTILRDNRLLPEGEPYTTKETAESNWKKLNEYIDARRTGKLDTLDAETKRYAEPIYNNLFQSFARDKYSFNSADNRQTVKEKIIENQESVVEDLSDELSQENEKVLDARSRVINPLDRSSIASEQMAEVLKSKDIDSYISELGDDKDTITANKIRTILTKGENMFRRGSAYGPLQQKIEKAAITTVGTIRRYLESKRLFESAENTILKLKVILVFSLEQAIRSELVTKAKKKEVLDQFEKILGEYRKDFVKKGDRYSISETDSLLREIENMKTRII